ncbi:MAG: DMT family transporter [Candidatus Micrarchaeales archaeon]
MRISTKAYIYLVASLIIGSFTPALLVLTQGTNALELFMFASLISIPMGLALVVKKGKLSGLKNLLGDKRKLAYMALAAILAYATFGYGIAYAERFISASLTTVLFRLNPLLMLAFLPIVLRERLSKRQVIALGLGVAGVIIGITGGNISGISGTGNLTIMLFVVMLAVGYALSSVIIKKQMIDNDVYLAAATFVLALFYMVLFFAGGFQFAQLNATDIGIVVYIAATNVFSFGMFTYALKILKTTMVTNVYLFSPFFTFIWADMLFGTPIRIYYLAIAALAGVGIVIQKDDKIGGSYLSSTSDAPKHSFTIFDVTGAFAGEGDPAVQDIVSSGGRVFATKVHRSHAHHISSMIAEQKFAHTYTGEEAHISSQAGFVREILGVGNDEAMVIKAGGVPENDSFFDELNARITAPVGLQ